MRPGKKDSSEATSRCASSEWEEYVQRLEQIQLQARIDRRRREAEALDRVSKKKKDPQLKTEAAAKRSAAEEFEQTLAEMEKGARGDI